MPHKGNYAVDKIFHAAAGTKKYVTEITGKAISAVTSLPTKIEGRSADKERGKLLYKQGYGDYYDSAREVARKGKSGGIHRKSGVAGKYARP